MRRRRRQDQRIGRLVRRSVLNGRNGVPHSALFWRGGDLSSQNLTGKVWLPPRDSNLRRLRGVSGAGAACRNPERSEGSPKVRVDRKTLAAPQGFEPRYADPESAVLPLNEGAVNAVGQRSCGALLRFIDSRVCLSERQPCAGWQSHLAKRAQQNDQPRIDGETRSAIGCAIPPISMSASFRSV